MDELQQLTKEQLIQLILQWQAMLSALNKSKENNT